jgi:hypothetical protein
LSSAEAGNLLKNLSTEQKAALAENLTDLGSLDKTTQDALSQALSQQQLSVDQQLVGASTDAALKAAARDAALQKLAGCTSDCAALQQDADKAKAEAEAAQKRLAELQAQKERLAAAKTTLQPPATEPDSQRGTIRIPGGKGFPPPPLPAPSPPPSTGFKFPNIHKDPSGTDVLAWMKHLFGGGDKPQSSNCPDSSQAPPAGACSEGSWQSEEVNGCKSWRCVRPRILSFSSVPQEVVSGETTTLGWITEAMKSCVVSSPDLPQFTEENKNYTNVNGAVKTPPLTTTTSFELSCVPSTNATSTKKTLTVGVLP